MTLATDCESIRFEFLGQPVNTVTSVAFLIAGVLVMRSGSRWVGWALFGTGIGSFMFHGPMPDWASWVHDVSVYLLTGVVVLSLLKTKRSRSEIVPLGLAVVSGIAWWLGGEESPLCYPGSPLQFHGIWHLGIAAAIAWWFTGILHRATH